MNVLLSCLSYLEQACEKMPIDLSQSRVSLTGIHPKLNKVNYDFALLT